MEDFFFVKTGRECVPVFLKDLLYLESADRYLRFVTTQKSFIGEGSLTSMEQELPGHLFCRIHKSYLIALRKINKFSRTNAIVGEANLPIGRAYRPAFLKKVFISGKGG